MTDLTHAQDVTNRRFLGLRNMVGNTPLLAIRYRFQGREGVIHAKAENLNMTGSIKDRMALHILRRGYESGDLQPGSPIFEATSGNTGISIAALGRALGHPVTIFMPDWMSQERIQLIRSFGAKIVLVSKEEGGFLGSIEMAENAATAAGNGFLPRQFSNQDNIAAHEATTGPEIWYQLVFNSLKPDALVAGVGTGGTVMGAGRYLRERHPDIALHPLEPANSPTLTTGRKVGKHRIQGISDEFIPPIVDLSQLDDVISVDDGDGIIMAQRLASELGIGVGISSGANFLGAVQLREKLGPESVVVTILPDDNKKYLTTDLLREEPVKEGFLSVDVELLDFSSQKRVCFTCCDPENCNQAMPLVLEQSEQLPPCPHRGSAQKPQTF